MKKLVLLAVLATAAWSVDFSQMSTDELMKMRGTLSPSERPAFRAEMQKRMQNMSPAQRQQMMQGQTKGMKQSQGMDKNRGTGKGMQNRPTYSDYDLNGDDKITPKEFYDAQAARMNKKADEGKMMKHAGSAPSFETIDTDKNGVISPSEFSLHQQKHMQKMRQQKGL